MPGLPTHLVQELNVGPVYVSGNNKACVIEIWVAFGRAVVYHAQAAHAFSAGMKH